jgi:RNA polymerase sigma-70 factor, ECF subfamily
MTFVQEKTTTSKVRDTGNADLAAARAGDNTAFERLAEPFRHEILTHCYRILGSLEDAEDLAQETFLRAWRRLDTYEERASLRAWLYKIATNACLDALERRPKRLLPPASGPAVDADTPLETPQHETVWLEPFPDELLAPNESSPEARYEAHETITLSFLVALQVLPGRQRCVLILSDVLDWRPGEIAAMLGITLSAVNSLLHRARLTLEKHYPTRRHEAALLPPPDDGTRSLLERYVRAWESADIAGIVGLLREDAVFAMPPLPYWFAGRTSIRKFIEAAILHGDARGRWRLRPVQLNNSPSFAWYQKVEEGSGYQAYALQILNIEQGSISQATTFVDPSLFRLLHLPLELAAE